jgi:SAM-dependent methyltransferase
MGLGDFLVFDVKTTTFSDETFDVVFSAGVFHHVPFSEHFDLVCEVSRTLKNGGIFMIYEHNPFNPLTCHAVNTCPFDENAVLLKPIRLRQLFQEAGMEFLLQEYRVFSPSFLALLRPIEKNLAWLPFGGQYFVVSKKK